MDGIKLQKGTKLIKGVVGFSSAGSIGGKCLLFEDNGKVKCLASYGSMNSSWDMTSSSTKLIEENPEEFFEDTVQRLKSLPLTKVTMIYFYLFDLVEDQRKMAEVTNFGKLIGEAIVSR